jgi:hypothetical protein
LGGKNGTGTRLSQGTSVFTCRITTCLGQAGEAGERSKKQCSGGCRTFNRKLLSVFHVYTAPFSYGLPIDDSINPSLLPYHDTTTIFLLNFHMVKLKVYSTYGLQGFDTLNFIHGYLIPKKCSMHK